jgi:hypothetical protein
MPLTLLLEKATARKIQRAWRAFKTKDIARKFITMLSETQKPSDFFRANSYETLIHHAHRPEIMERMYRCIRHITKKVFVHHHGTPGTTTQAATLNRRVFVAAYMIAIFPNNSIEVIGMHEQVMIIAANEFITALETTAESLAAGAKITDIPGATAFTTKMYMYQRRFTVWRTNDAPNVQARMERALAMLTTERDMAPPDSPNRVNLAAQVVRIRTKLVETFGAGALQAFDARGGVPIQPPPNA